MNHSSEFLPGFRIVTRAEFLQWLRSKPADTPSCLSDTHKCVMADFAREVFKAVNPDAAENTVFEGNGLDRAFQFEEGLSFYQFEGEETYGEVADKIEWYESLRNGAGNNR